MKAKPDAPEEFRMSGAEFDKMMRGALSAPPPKAESTKPRRSKKRKTTTKENRLRSLYNIDADRIPELTPAQWTRFRDDPPRYLTRADDEQSTAIWREVERRQKRPA